MAGWLRKIIAPEILDAVKFPRIRIATRREQSKHIKSNRAKKARLLHLARRAEARMREAASLKTRAGRLFPPQQGHRRPEWSSAVDNQWNKFNKNYERMPEPEKKSI
jgi:hypothetical protein